MDRQIVKIVIDTTQKMRGNWFNTIHHFCTADVDLNVLSVPARHLAQSLIAYQETADKHKMYPKMQDARGPFYALQLRTPREIHGDVKAECFYTDPDRAEYQAIPIPTWGQVARSHANGLRQLELGDMSGDEFFERWAIMLAENYDAMSLVIGPEQKVTA